jgi:hypothetical protein
LTLKKQQPRPPIPEQVQRELWGRAAGRCEFRGCNEPLYRDGLTQQRSNLACISHIVSFSPDGPRGDPLRSKLLEKDINNLILTCRKHGKLVDDLSRIAEYPEELLLTFKREHERRVRLLTESREDAQTHMLLLQAPIDGQPSYINPTAAIRAILPLYPAEEHPYLIDLNGVTARTDEPTVFRVMSDSITQRVNAILAPYATTEPMRNLAVFALAPIPLLVHLGYLLGDVQCVDLYQRHRGHQDWTWNEQEEADTFYEVHEPSVPLNRVDQIALVLSVSEEVSHARVAATLGCEPLIYEIRARDANRDFLRSRKRLELFGYEVRKILFTLRDRHPHEQAIHLFAALPAPMAVEFGRNLKGFDAPYMMYEYVKTKRVFIPALLINDGKRG